MCFVAGMVPLSEAEMAAEHQRRQEKRGAGIGAMLDEESLALDWEGGEERAGDGEDTYDC